MSGRFAAFSFVDRILSLVPGVKCAGRFEIPADVPGFAPALVAESVGQLAAWAAMRHSDFRGRPVAALAGETRFLRVPRPGETLALDVDIHHCDADSVAYEGRARIDGETVVELLHCLGPMLPLADFDDPQAMQSDFDRLMREGVSPGRFRGLPPLVPTQRDSGDAKTLVAMLDVPCNAPFFTDHFPRRPVFPATLLLDAEIGLARELAARALGCDAGEVVPQRLTHVKARAFIAPGTSLELTAELAHVDATSVRVHLSARAEDRVVATARAELACGGAS